MDQLIAGLIGMVGSAAGLKVIEWALKSMPKPGQTEAQWHAAVLRENDSLRKDNEALRTSERAAGVEAERERRSGQRWYVSYQQALTELARTQTEFDEYRRLHPPTEPW